MNKSKGFDKIMIKYIYHTCLFISVSPFLLQEDTICCVYYIMLSEIPLQFDLGSFLFDHKYTESREDATGSQQEVGGWLTEI